MNSEIQIATSVHSSPEQLDLLARSESELVRATVALNASCSKETLDFLSQDKSSWVRGFIEKRALSEANLLSIHPTAIIHPDAKIGQNVTIGAFSIIHKNVEIGDRTTIGSHCELGHPIFGKKEGSKLQIGKDSLIRSHSIFYEGSSFGDKLITGHRVTVREGTKAGENLQIGTLSDIQGKCEIGNFVRFHSNVHIGQHSKIGNYVWIFPYVVLTNDPHPPSELMQGVTVKDFVAIATMTVILPGVTLNEGVLVGAHSSVGKDVDANMVAVGSPAKPICPTNKIELKDGSQQPAYPWRRHFHRGYPDQVIKDWIAEFKN